jgi:chloramphenicol 3-O-phosphotransferase
VACRLPYEAFFRLTMMFIVLNGPSSSGKTTLSKVLQSSFTEPSIYISLDHLISMLPERITRDHDMLVEELDKYIADFNRSILSISSACQHCIIDYVFERRNWYFNLRDTLRGEICIWIGLHCDAPELARREHLRGDRKIGLGVSHMHSVHHDIVYDLKLNTSDLSLDQQASQVLKVIRPGV